MSRIPALDVLEAIAGSVESVSPRVSIAPRVRELEPECRETDDDDDCCRLAFVLFYEGVWDGDLYQEHHSGPIDDRLKELAESVLLNVQDTIARDPRQSPGRIC